MSAAYSVFRWKVAVVWLMILVGCSLRSPSSEEILVEVDGPSMAPSLWGPHICISCVYCQRHVRLDGMFRRPHQAVCEHCGELLDLPQNIEEVPGERLPLRRFSASGDVRSPRPSLPAMRTAQKTQPQRFDVVVIQTGSGRVIKRIVGLPGETVEIRTGELWINGRPLQKTMSEFAQQAILVASSTFSSSHDKCHGHWHRDVDRQGNRCCWHFVPIINYMSPFRGKPTQITDVLPFNLAVSHQSHAVRDVIVDLELAAKPGQFEMGWRFGELDIVLYFVQQQNKCRASLGRTHSPPDGSAMKTWEWDQEDFRNYRWLLGSIDGRLWVVRDGAPLEGLPTVAIPNKNQTDLDRPQAGVTLSVCCRPDSPDLIRRITLWRDIYYADFPKAGRSPQRQLSPDEYFVLGDNSAISVDSRQESFGFVRRNAILGYVQVPDRSEILATPRPTDSDILVLRKNEIRNQ